MPTLHVQLLGDFHLAYGDTPVAAMDSARLQALLAYLLLHRHAGIPRQQIAFQFWPDSSEAQARANLRRTLHQLRNSMPDVERYLYIERRALQWRTDADFSLDVADFERNVEAFDRLNGHDPVAACTSAQEAIALYVGDLLPACYDDWIQPERERLRRYYVDTLARLIHLLEARREYAQAITYAERLLQYDLLREQSHAILLRLHALSGDRAAALNVYHTCATVLERELGVDPGIELQAAYARLLSQGAKTDAATQVVSKRGQGIRLVGRHPEWQQLCEAWRRAEAGHAHMVYIGGEAGIGKSRLAVEMGRWAEEQGALVAMARSYAMADRLAYAPVIDLLRSKPLYAALQRLEPIWLTEAARLLPELLVEYPDLPRPQALSERWQRQRLFEALARGISMDGRAKLLIVDDLQWSDPDTLEWLGFLLRFAPRDRLVVVGTMRTEEVDALHPARQLALDLQRTEQISEITLGPLSQEEAGGLATLVAARELDGETLQALYGQSVGNPLFVVELIRAGYLEVCAPSPPAHARGADQAVLPPKIQAVVQSRLNRLSADGQRLAQVAVTFGRAFSYAALHVASGYDEDRLVQGLDELWQRGLVREQGPRMYDFSHDLIREATYADISRVQRPVLHARVARALELVYADDLDAVSAQIALHLERAGEAEQAVGWYVRAAEIACLRLDDGGAIALLNRALALLKSLPETPANQRRELDILLQQHLSLTIAQGHWSPVLGANGARAIELCKALDDPIRLCQAFESLRLYHYMRAHYQRSRAISEQMVTTAEQIERANPELGIDNAVRLSTAHRCLGHDHVSMGNLISARLHYEEALAREQNYGTLMCLAGLLWLLGLLDQARRCASASVQAARETGHPYFLAVVATEIARFAHLQRRLPSMKRWTEKSLALATKYELPFLATMSTIMQGRIWAAEGMVDQGIAQLRAGLARLDEMDHFCERTYTLGLLAESYGFAKQYRQGLNVLEQALALVERNEEGLWHAELLRLRGEFLCAHEGPSAKSEASFEEAIAVAQQQQAKSLELRASVSLARLWQRTGQQAQAYTLLSNIYGWFTEGFNSPDLRAARSLLEQLGHEN